ncbi:transposase [Pontibacillus yanchengensis]|uniref:Transposase n=1 Tax=Pontibacillus yanchengensis TaxID=462910 RepID=A0A6I5A5D3_9BACI|nr:transposase [Pontibacillus yanchengensis]MYL35575.1 transposase [Pontibacillus yanchengensis]
MSIIRQDCLFDMQELYDLEPTQRYNELFSAICIDPAVSVVMKKSRFGRPVNNNYPAMIQSLIVRYVERIPEIQLLVKRLQDDVQFKLDCGFLVSDTVPSEASYSRMITKILKSDALDRIESQLLSDALTEEFIDDEANVAFDAGHFEARNRAPSKKEDPYPEKPKKRGRKSKAEREKWLKEQEAYEASLPLYQKKIEDQLGVSYQKLHDEMPLVPTWDVKKNSEGKNAYWFGFKGHFAVETKSQFILHRLMSSGNLNDGKAAIPLMKGIQDKLPSFQMKYGILDAGYDFPAIYKQIHQLQGYSIIAYNKRNEPEPIGFDQHFAPTCVREHSYRYDSFDSKYQTLKYTAPKECETCPLAHESLCQKVYKVRIETDLRRYSAPARGSQAWENRYKERTAVERVISYLKELFQLNNVRYRTGKRAKVHFDFATLAYNGMKLASMRLQRRKETLKPATI